MDYFELLRYRRSVRKFTDEQVTADDLGKIILAANAAPVGSNQYGDIHLTVVRSRQVLDKLAQASVKRWEDKKKMTEIIGQTSGISIDSKIHDPFYGAGTVIFVSHRRQTLQPGIQFANTACVVQSMHMAATELGLGSVFIWGALEAMREIPELDNTSELNLPEDFEPLLGIAIGYPANNMPPRNLKTDKISVNYLC